MTSKSLMLHSRGTRPRIPSLERQADQDIAILAVVREILANRLYSLTISEIAYRLDTYMPKTFIGSEAINSARLAMKVIELAGR